MEYRQYREISRPGCCCWIDALCLWGSEARARNRVDDGGRRPEKMPFSRASSVYPDAMGLGKGRKRGKESLCYFVELGEEGSGGGIWRGFSSGRFWGFLVGDVGIPRHLLGMRSCFETGKLWKKGQGWRKVGLIGVVGLKASGFQWKLGFMGF